MSNADFDQNQGALYLVGAQDEALSVYQLKDLVVEQSVQSEEN